MPGASAFDFLLVAEPGPASNRLRLPSKKPALRGVDASDSFYHARAGIVKDEGERREVRNSGERVCIVPAAQVRSSLVRIVSIGKQGR